LAETGALFDGYHPEMEAVHLANAELLEQTFEAIGWPGRARGGEDGAAAAFIILQHAISRPDLQRRGLVLILNAIDAGDANPLDAAYLSDRIAVFEGGVQMFGTQLDWTEAGLVPAPMDDEERVERRRADIGLPPLGESLAQARAGLDREKRPAPHELADRRNKFEAWARKVGWRA
jgi:hypothetical protein